MGLGTSIEVLAQAMERLGDRIQAVRFLKEQFEKFGNTPISARIQKNLNLLTMEGQPAPKLEIGQVAWPPPAIASEAARATGPSFLLGTLLRRLPCGGPSPGTDTEAVRPGGAGGGGSHSPVRLP